MAEGIEEIYQALLDAGINGEEINRQLQEKEAEFQGFMTKQAMLYLIAKDNGVNINSSENDGILKYIKKDVIDYNDFAIPISKITENMKNIVLTGEITEIFEIREFSKKDGTAGIVGSFKICDQSGCIKIVLWNNHVNILDNVCFQKGEIVQIIGGYSKKGLRNVLEVHLSRQGKIVMSPEGGFPLDLIESEPLGFSEKEERLNPSKIRIIDLHEIEGFIRYVEGIIKVDSFKEFTLKNGEKSFLLKLVLKDETASIIVNIWGIQAVEAYRILKDGDNVKLFNLTIKLNTYSDEKELNSTKSFKIF